jgi:CTP synthase
VENDDVIASLDAETIYEVPLLMQQEGLDMRVIDKLGLPTKNADLKRWTEFVDKVKHPAREVEIALVGKYVEHHDAYKSIVEALIHGGAMNNTGVKIKWVQSDYLTDKNVAAELEGVSGVLVAPGFWRTGNRRKTRSCKICTYRRDTVFRNLSGDAVCRD